MPHVIIRIWELTLKKYATKERGHISIEIVDREGDQPNVYISYRPAEPSGIVAWLTWIMSALISKKTCFTLAEDQALEGSMWRSPIEIHLKTLSQPEIMSTLWQQFSRDYDFNALDPEFFHDSKTHNSFDLSIFLLNRAGLADLVGHETVAPGNDPALRRAAITIGAAVGCISSLSTTRVIDALTREFDTGSGFANIIELLQQAETRDIARRRPAAAVTIPSSPRFFSGAAPPETPAQPAVTALVGGAAQIHTVIINGDVSITGQQNITELPTRSLQ